jgi:translocation and assembly module TamB
MDQAEQQNSEILNPGRPRRSPRRRFVRRFLIALVLAPLFIVVGAVLLLQIDGVSTRLVNELAARLSPWTTSNLTVASASLDGIGHIVLRGVRLVNDDGNAMATIDTASFRIRPLALLRRAIIISDARIAGADVTLRQRPDSVWDLLEPFVDPGEPGEPREIRINGAEIVRSRVEARYLAETDSVLRIESINIRAPRYTAGRELRVDVDSVAALIYPASRPQSPASLHGKFSLARGVLHADGVRLSSDSSDVRMDGTFVIPTGDDQGIKDIDFRLIAQPLDFRDVGALVPGFDVPGSLRLDARVTGTSHAMEFAAHGQSFDGATINATGRVDRRAGDSVRYLIDAEVRGLDPHLWAAKAPASRVDADAKVTLAGMTPETIDGTALFKVGRTEIGSVVIMPSVINARFENGTAHYTVRGGVSPWASVEGSGKVRPFDASISADFAGNVRQLGDTTVGSVTVAGINGFVSATWRDARIEGRAAIAGGTVNAVTLDTANAAFDYKNATLAMTANAVSSAGRLSLDGRATDLNRTPAWTVNRLSVASLDLARIDTSLAASNLNGSLTGSGRGVTPETMLANADIRVSSSNYGEEKIDSASFSVALRNGVLDMRGIAEAPRGHADFIASMKPFTAERTFRIEPLRFRDVVVSTGSDHKPVALAGVLTATGALPRDTFPSATGTLELDPTPFNNGRLASGWANFSIAGDSARADATIRTGDGTIDVLAVAQIARTNEGGLRIAKGRAEGDAHLPDLNDLVGRDSISAALDAHFLVDADGTDPESMAWTADVIANGKYATAVVDTLTFRARIARGILNLDTLLLRSNVATGNGSGVLAIADNVTPPDSARLHVRVDADSIYAADELLPLKNFSLRGGHLILDATNSKGGIDAKTSVTILGLISPGAWADSVQLDGTARLERMKPTTVNATFAGNDLGYSTTEIESVQGSVEYNPDSAKFDVTITGDESHSIRTAGTAIHAEHSLTFANMVLAVDSAAWNLPRPASVTYGSRIAFTNFVLERGSRRITLAGAIDRNAAQDFTMKLDSVPILGFAEFIGIDGADGMLDGSVHIAGPATNVAVTADMNLVLLGTRGKVVMAQAPDSRLRVDVNLTDSLGKALAITGTIPLAISLVPGDSTPIEADGPLALSAKSDSFSIGFLAPFARPYGISRSGGAVRTDINVSGTFADPAMSGIAALLDAHVEYPRQGIAYRGINGEFTLGGDRVHVQSLTIVSEGTATFAGDIVMETAAKPTLALTAKFDGFRAAENEWTRLGVSGTARLEGDVLAPQVSGNLRLIDTDLFADPVGKTSGGSAVELTKEDFRMLEYYFGYDPTRIRQQTTQLLDPWTMDLQVTVGPDTWLRRRRSPEMSIQLEGSLDVKKAAGDSIQLFGNINVLPERSYFQQFGRRFAVSSGSVAFNGPMMQWVADFNARYLVPSAQDPGTAEVVITIDVDGTLDDLNVTLGGDPAMETADILSYLATGRPAASAAEFGGSDLADVGATIAASQLTSVIEDASRKSVGLDVVEIRHNGIKGATIVAGRYVNPRLFVGFEQPLVIKDESDERERGAVERSSEVQLEYRLYRWLLASLEGNQSNFSFLFKVRRAF